MLTLYSDAAQRVSMRVIDEVRRLEWLNARYAIPHADQQISRDWELVHTTVDRYFDNRF